MLIEILISIFTGILVGIITGLIPGIHINTVGVVLVSLSFSLFSKIPPLFLALFIVAVAITHTFLDFIPSIFLGCPDTETQLSILPGHELLMEGKGYEAIMKTAKGGLFATFAIIILAFPLAFGVSLIYNQVHSWMFWILLGTCAVLVFTEKRKFLALAVLIISGILGLCILNSEMKEPLLPMLTGLFGSSMLIISIKNKIKIPQQEITISKEKIWKPLLGSLIASPLCGFLPGLGSGQAVVLGNAIVKTEKKNFLTLIGATNTLVMGLSFVSLYAISKTRTGAAAAIKEILGSPSEKTLIVILAAILISGIISYFITGCLAKFLSQKICKINYTLISVATLLILVIITFIFSGFLGILVLTASTFLGIYFHELPVKKTNMMGCLLIPTIIYYGLNLI